MKFDFMRQETNFAFAKITSPQEMVMHAKFTIDINGREGDVDLCIPFWVLEPLKGVLYENMQLVSEPDQVWVEKLNNEVQSAPVTAVAVLARKEMHLGDVLSMAGMARSRSIEPSARRWLRSCWARAIGDIDDSRVNTPAAGAL